MRDIEDLRRRAGLDELLHHLAAEETRIADLAPQLAIGEGAGVALDELHVRLGIEHALAPQAPGVAGALAHGLAAFQHDRAEAHLRQQQGAEDAARAEAHHHRAQRQIGGGVRRRHVAHVGRARHARIAGQPREQRVLERGRRRSGERHVDDVDLQQVGLAGIEAALVDVDAFDGGGVDAEQALHGAIERIGGRIERELDFRESEHGGACVYQAGDGEGGRPAIFVESRWRPQAAGRKPSTDR